MSHRTRRFHPRFLLSVVGVFFLFASLALAADAFASAPAPQTPAQATPPAFLAFESGPVRPMALTPSGNHLIVTNTPDNRIELFQVNQLGNLIHVASIPVGLEPVAVAARTDTEVWVVNHLSDSLTIVDLAQRQVVRTLLVGDEPRDILFAGTDRSRAFITTAHRGQHRSDPSIAAVPGAGDPQFTTPGLGRADVWVFDATNLGDTIGGTPLKIVELFGDTPRALAVTPDGNTVYAAVFNSGNQTTAINDATVCDGFETAGLCDGDGITSPNGLPNGQLPGGNPGPSTNYAGAQAPEVGLIVHFNNDTQLWEDELGRNWSNGVRFFLPDRDVFALDANTLTETVSFIHVGTTLFNMVVNPANGNLYVANTDAQNTVRFEGAGVFGGSTVQGDLARAQITVIDPASGAVNLRHLNKHIDYNQRPAPPGVKEHSLATPLEMVVTADGAILYVAAFGSGQVGVLPTAALEADTFDPTVESSNYITVTGGGPAGLVLNEADNRLYVFTRFDNSISVIDLAARAELNHIPLYNPEPAAVVTGRPFLYDALNTSSNGEASCASCHIFGDMDHVAWDLGDPDGDVGFNPLTINLDELVGDDINGTGELRDFHPMKGPMTTQTLRGMINSGAMHWRGDRADGFFGQDPLDSHLSFRNFIVAFPGLVGGDTPVTDPDLQANMTLFADFALSLTLPPNPVRNLDNSLTEAQQRGFDFFIGPRRADGFPILPGLGFTCEGCHTLEPAQGFFGTEGEASFENLPQIAKIAHLRNVYQKIGMFGMPDTDLVIGGDNDHMGDQIRGYGYVHDGATDTLFRFVKATVFEDTGIGVGFDGGDPQRRDVEQYLLAFDGDLAPIVGQQITLDATNVLTVTPRIQLLIQRAEAPFVSQILGGAVTECDLVVQIMRQSRPIGLLYDPTTTTFLPDTAGQPGVTINQIGRLVTRNNLEATFLCVPPGSGPRIAHDRDQDGVWNGDELSGGTDPANPGSVANACQDSLDNDGDGLTDLADAGCQDANWNVENPQCSDGYDNDGDGLADDADPACAGQPWWNNEGQPNVTHFGGTNVWGILTLLALSALGLVWYGRHPSFVVTTAVVRPGR